MMPFRKTVETIARENPEKPFLWHQGKKFSYADALAIKDEFSELLGGFDHVAIISNSGDVSYLAIFASVLSDATFMHLNIEWHANRVSDVLQQATPDVVICHDDWAAQNADMIENLGYDKVTGAKSASGFFEPLAVYKKQQGRADRLAEYKLEKNVDDLIYVMFTSGSTGRPKGVPIDVKSAGHYAKSMVDTFGVGYFESWLQPADLHFDLSMLTVLSAWLTCGEIIAIPSGQSPFGPRFVKKFAIDNWTSVPSVIARSNALGMLGENVMPSLKRSFFCGEALPADIATSWADASPDAHVYNLYGPTEATVSLTWHKFDKTKDLDAVVAIGEALPGSGVRLAHDGEIELGGPQVFHGYLGNPQEIATYLNIDSDGTRWYKTGDIGEISEQGVLQFKGRKDWQVKLKGYRVEIEGIEAAIRKATNSSLAAVVPIEEVSENSFNKLCAFVEQGVDIKQLKAELLKALPDYMIPELIVSIADFPKNANGKIDRNTLVSLAEKENSA